MTAAQPALKAQYQAINDEPEIKRVITPRPLAQTLSDGTRLTPSPSFLSPPLRVEDEPPRFSLHPRLIDHTVNRSPSRGALSVIASSVAHAVTL